MHEPRRINYSASSCMGFGDTSSGRRHKPS